MLYTVVFTNSSEEIERVNIEAKDFNSAHIYGKTLAPQVKVYPATTNQYGEIITSNLQEGALMVVRRTTANMIRREGHPSQFRLYNECRRDKITDHDVLDLIEAASEALIDAVRRKLEIEEQYHMAYLNVNHELYANHLIGVSASGERLIYIEDIDGDVVNVTKEISRIISPAERYYPLEISEKCMANEQIGELLHDILSMLTVTEAKILKYAAYGFSIRQIGDELNRSAATVQYHINKIRTKAREVKYKLHS